MPDTLPDHVDSLEGLANQIEAAAHVTHCIADNCEDEGDRVYLGSTNDAHTLVRQSRQLLRFAAALRARKDR